MSTKVFKLELYKLLINQLGKIDKVTLSQCLKIDPKTCGRYSFEASAIGKKAADDQNYGNYKIEEEDNEPYLINTDGYKSFNQHKHFIPCINSEALKAINLEVFEKDEISEKVKALLLKLLANNLLSLNKYDGSIDIIINCIENKKYLEIDMQFEPNETREKMYLSPVYIDLDNSYLYAVSQGEILYRLNIYSLEGVKVSENNLKFSDNFNKYFDNIVGLSYENHLQIEDNDIVDSFGSPYIDGDKVFTISLLLDNYAKSELLKYGINLKNFIKHYEYEKYSFLLKTTVYDLTPVFDFIVRFNSHTLLLGDKNAKKKLVKHIGEVVNNLNDLQNRLTNKKS
jgi:hypothetical protein